MHPSLQETLSKLGIKEGILMPRKPFPPFRNGKLVEAKGESLGSQFLGTPAEVRWSVFEKLEKEGFIIHTEAYRYKAITRNNRVPAANYLFAIAKTPGGLVSIQAETRKGSTWKISAVTHEPDSTEADIKSDFQSVLESIEEGRFEASAS